MSKKLLMAATGAAALFAATPAFAQSTAGVILDIDMAISPTCKILGNVGNINNGRTRISFGDVNPLTQTTDVDSDGSVQGTAGVTVTCNTSSTIASFALGGGKAPSGSTRRMGGRLNGGLVGYRVYSSASRAPGTEYTGSPVPVNGGNIVPGAPFTIPFFGRVTLAEITRPDLPADTYDDVVIGTLTF